MLIKNEKIRKIIIFLFVSVQAVLYVFIHAEFFANTGVISYLSIVLCFLFALLFTARRDKLFIAAALGLTLAADYFLVILDNYYITALCFFSAVQICYCLKIYFSTDFTGLKTINLIFRILLIAVFEIIAALILKEFNLLVSIAAFYFANLISNTVFAFIDIKKDAFFAAGLALFVLCDIFAAINFLPGLGLNINSFLNWIIESPVNLPWIFYLPSQTFIALSVVDFGGREGVSAAA